MAADEISVDALSLVDVEQTMQARSGETLTDVAGTSRSTRL